MAKFRAGGMSDATFRHEITRGSAGESPGANVHDRLIGNIISEAKSLTTEQVDAVVRLQREKRCRFGEAAIALGYVSHEDVLFALAQQFHYPYAPEEHRKLNSELVALNQPFSHQAEAFRAIRSQVLMRLFDSAETHCAVAVVSANSGDGKTYFSANLAVTLAQLGGRTLLVDADLRGPRQHEVFSLDNGPGLSGILSGRAETQVIRQISSIPSLFVLPVGTTPPNPLELFERPAFGLLMREFVSKFDHVIVDTPAAVYGSDAAVIAAKCGAALVIARKDASRLGTLQDLVITLSESSAKIAGVIMNEY